jgi:hypothetical protein
MADYRWAFIDASLATIVNGFGKCLGAFTRAAAVHRLQLVNSLLIFNNYWSVLVCSLDPWHVASH